MDHFTGKWLAAVSGGPDSMALAGMCLEKGIDIALAHVNYHHRDQADEEEAYVRFFAEEHGLMVYVRNEPFVFQGNFEAAARAWRYDFFAEVVKANGFAGVLVAHQEDDLIETFLMQEEKELIPEYYGLAAEIMYHGVLIRRPLLDQTAAQLKEYCRSHQIRYYTDATNASEEYTRNRIRHQQVEPLSRSERDMILREIRMKNAVLQERRCRVKTLIRQEKIRLDEYRKQKQEERDTLLRIFLEQVSEKAISLAYLREIDSVLMKKDDFMIPFRQHWIVQKDSCFFLYQEQAEDCDVYSSLPELKNGAGRYYRVTAGQPGVNAVSVTASDFPLKIRSFREGDAIQMRFGTKAVHRFFIDRHIPLYERRRWPIVENARGEIILVPGLGCDASHYSTKPDFNVLQYSS